MLKATHHRGPEASLFFIEDNVCLGHNRLKIIDLSDEANQPFVYEDMVIVFNGEIYNYLELKVELISKGFKFRTASDTEVLCAAYRYWGKACVERFIGMWAFAIWDKQTQTLFCSRDRFGIKPFYYLRQGEGIWFASEIKALKRVPGFDNTLNVSQLNRGIAFGWVENGEETVYTNLKTLPAAHNLIWRNGNVSIEQYWDISFTRNSKSSLSFNDKKEQFRELFFESIKLHSRSDVANGICLSGGLDSSAIASAFCTIYPDTPIKSFTIFFEGPGKVDERPFVQKVVDKYPNVQPYYYQPSHKDVGDLWHSAAYQSDVPVWGSSHLAGFFVMRLAKQNGVTVVNDGQGADEYLGGYLHSFYRLIGKNLAALKPGKAISLLQALAQREQFTGRKKIDFLSKGIAGMFSDENRMAELEYMKYKALLNTNMGIKLENKTSDKFDNFLYHLIFNETLQPILYFEDRKSMQYSIESRVPFLNHRLIEFAFTLHDEDRISPDAKTKYILRESLKDILPEEVYNRKDKKGFVTPGEVEWLSGPLRFLLEEIDVNRFYWLNKPLLQKTVHSYMKGDYSKATLVWRIAAASYWMKNFA